ncbi:protein YgfX [Sinimarinibacterium thermocellulolyticum]|uniref:Protein YgfX n=1 Tax=Sinimarinibacterium thermocellulolyticum TaxID=3170016 RepID=A0ABV2A8W5_9GAMM
MQTIDLSLRPSMRALRAVFVLHLCCLGLLVWAQPPTLPLLVFAAAVAGSWLWVRRHPALGFGPRALVRLVAHADGGFSLYQADGTRRQGRLLDDAIVRGPWLVLRFAADDGARSVRLIGGDELSADNLRRLRAWLSAPTAAG